MGKQIDLNGVFVPVPTNFDQSGNLDLNNFAKIIQYTNKFEFKGVVVAAKIGEGPYMTSEEKCRLVQTARQNLKPGRQLLADAGREGTKQTIELCNRMADQGADGVLVHPPHWYSNRMNPQALTSHYRQIADHSKVQVIIYNIPSYTNGVDLDQQTIISLASHQNIVGISDNSENMNKMREVVNQTKNQNFKVLAGSAHFMVEALNNGCTGVLSAVANILPNEVLQIQNLCQSGKQNEAQQLQNKISNISQSIKRTYGPAGVKYLLDKQGQPGGQPRSPIMPLRDDEKQSIENEFRQAGFSF